MREAGGAIVASHPELGDYTLSCDGAPELLFTENESNLQRLWGQPNPTPYVKDAFHRYVVAGERDAVNPGKTGTKAAARYVLEVPAGGCEVVCASGFPPRTADEPFGAEFDEVFRQRLFDADEFYDRITPPDARPRTSAACTARRSPGCSGPSSTTTSTSTGG